MAEFTPRGYFLASPNAADYVEWRQGARLLPAAKRRQRFMRAQAVRKALAG